MKTGILPQAERPVSGVVLTHESPGDEGTPSDGRLGEPRIGVAQPELPAVHGQGELGHDGREAEALDDMLEEHPPQLLIWGEHIQRQSTSADSVYL